ncbi:hypothetical protein BU52_26270 [Streptomyces toyocaensis]|uniref:UspA domain-containing protein n=1 Tax=Streptomyces toyocaensis TaxID=55952 RepID=A0A081XL95_STRTO|nr:hypothetical protein BU52_26270 [Streptomyces toyocaensis]
MKSPTVTAGLDGSRESLTAAGWTAREAALRGAALRLVHVGAQQPSSFVPFAGNAVALPPVTPRRSSSAAAPAVPRSDRTSAR